MSVRGDMAEAKRTHPELYRRFTWRRRIVTYSVLGIVAVLLTGNPLTVLVALAVCALASLFLMGTW